jgi:hypothetical protein
MGKLCANKPFYLSSCAFSWLTTLLISVLATEGVAFGTTVLKLSFEELVRRSGRVILGRCLSTESRWNQENTLIFTYSKFAVSENLKGQANGFVEVMTVGGVVNGITQTVSGMPHFEVNEEALLFLEPFKKDRWQPLGLSQGKFRIEKNSQTGDKEAVLNLSGLRLYGTSSGDTSIQTHPQRVPLDRLVEAIKHLVGN